MAFGTWIAPDGLRKVALGAHGLLGVWLVVNGAAHQGHVLWKHHAGTLRLQNDLGGLLGVGAGLLLAGGLATWTLAPLVRPEPSVVPAFLALAALAGIVVAVAVRYGMTFLGGTIALGLLDGLALLAFALGRR